MAEVYKEVLTNGGLKGQAFHIYHVIRCHWLCVASTDLSFATEMAEFPLLFVF